MKDRINPFKRFLNLLGILIIALIIIGSAFYHYLFLVPGWYSTWPPEQIVRGLSIWIYYEDGEVRLSRSGITLLNADGMWMQILDESGNEVFSHNRPADIPTSYLASELITINLNNDHPDYTIFARSIQLSDQTFNYLVGFPYRIGHFTLIYNGERIESLFPIFIQIIIVVVGASILFVLGYIFWLSKHLSTLIKGINDISSRDYEPLKETGTFSEISRSINLMNNHIRRSDRAKVETDRLRQEWIVNITHDLKTPLSPIKGYAELFTDHPDSEVKESGMIILKNVEHTEVLINDMKLAYQLETNVIPYQPHSLNIVRYLREIMIDIINNPLSVDRELEFESSEPEIETMFDPNIFYRAVQNLIINALIHNPPGTTVKVSIGFYSQNKLEIIVQDNGKGMSEATSSRIFERYYRGTDTKQQTEGSGLGMAIAKQIVQLHGGKITVRSQIGKGTKFVLVLPIRKETEKNHSRN